MYISKWYFCMHVLACRHNAGIYQQINIGLQHHLYTVLVAVDDVDAVFPIDSVFSIDLAISIIAGLLGAAADPCAPPRIFRVYFYCFCVLRIERSVPVQKYLTFLGKAGNVTEADMPNQWMLNGTHR